eukprot:TRINITY_DN54750_c0_g1_i1.p1 TRINITY_DN54750_c0_g1~~TRINITY_DN54750_c0_g1_i1.p1  ORF type:complete len:252 (-),score=36.38 TRINITY_DN54750_c0_g1_i1:218-973(-)
MSGTRRGVIVTNFVHKCQPGEIVIIESPTPWSSPTDQEIEERRLKLSEEKRRLWQSPKQLHALLALGKAAKLRAEVEAYIGKPHATVRPPSALPQIAEARISRDDIDTYDAEDMENLWDYEQMCLEMEMCVKDIFAGIQAPCDMRGQPDGPNTFASRGDRSVRNETSAQGHGTGSSSTFHTTEASYTYNGFEHSPADGARTHKMTLPALVHAPALVPIAPRGKAPPKPRPRPPPPAERDGGMADQSSEQAQ